MKGKAKITPKVKEELETIRQKAGGMLFPKDVLEFARGNNGSATHAWFTARGAWEEKEAAEKYRLLLARDLIMRVHVVILRSPNQGKFTRAYVSQEADRHKGGGYRATVEVLSEEDQREELLHTAMIEMKRLQVKYGALEELQVLWAMLSQIAAKHQSMQLSA